MRYKYLFLSVFFLVATFARAQSKVSFNGPVKIGGIKQWIGVKGDDDRKPLLLFLHGGPGFSSKGYLKKAVKDLKKDFIVAQWDQRESGYTQAWNSVPETLSMEQMHQDTEEVVQYLLKTYKKDKLYLVGYSWGGFLGFEFANNHPELLQAFVSVSSMIHHNKGEELTRAYVLEQAKAENNTEAIKELSNLPLPTANWQDMYTLRKWTTFYVYGKKNDASNPLKLYEPWAATWFPIFMEAAAVNYLKKMPELKCPVYFFTSKKDFIAHYQLAEDYYNSIEAPQKELVWFPEVGHDIHSKGYKAFAKALLEIPKTIN